MTEHKYSLPALAAGIVALGLPAFWMFDLAFAGLGDWHSLVRHDFGLSDLVFLALGGLTMIAYLGLRNWLREQLNYRALDLPLVLLVALTAAFHGVFFLLALATLFLPQDVTTLLGVVGWIGFAVLFGLLDVIIAVLLLKDRNLLPGLLAGYAVVSGLLGLLELSVIFSFGALVLLPLQMALLALTLFYRPDVLEVV
jgi:hypothetical protein